MSSKNAHNNSPTSNDRDTSSSAPWMPIENNRGINGSPCSLPSACDTVLRFPVSSTQSGRFGVGQHHERNEGLRIWHLFESAQHCSAQHMVVSSNPVDTQDCSPRICICGSFEQMPRRNRCRPWSRERTGMARALSRSPWRIALPASSR